MNFKTIADLNQTIKNSLFKSYDFTTFETFIGSLMRELYKLKQVSECNSQESLLHFNERQQACWAVTGFH